MGSSINFQPIKLAHYINFDGGDELTSENYIYLFWMEGMMVKNDNSSLKKRKILKLTVIRFKL